MLTVIHTVNKLLVVVVWGGVLLMFFCCCCSVLFVRLLLFRVVVETACQRDVGDYGAGLCGIQKKNGKLGLLLLCCVNDFYLNEILNKSSGWEMVLTHRLFVVVVCERDVCQ